MALDILEQTGLMGSKLVETLMDPNAKLSVDQGEFLPSPDDFRRLIGKLNYLTIMRPDIVFVICMSAPSSPHWEAVLGSVKYFKGAPSDQRAISGYYSFLSGNLIS